ncbi:putative transferase CAF17, mitochondrial [Protobothrops mucrosquamatus]|uniref:putative transferase CAF17, mitochondrial n=1 Tax=Protobothrops mucrosquamatus TaxID=103944 RepID=UPI0010FBA4CD|nr:putative transferase CAF17, mitochondrial [Protobothrops mucrosquamatus]
MVLNRFTPSRSTLDHTQDGGAEVFSSSLVAVRQAAMLVRASAALRRGLPRNLHSGGSDIRAAAVCFPLSHRALLRLQGPETIPFLQGLLTNDVTPFAEVGGVAPRALYAHALNVQGRCLYDVIAYRLHENKQEEPHVLLECDAGLLDSFRKHLKLYKIRRKLDLSPCPGLSLWAVIPKEPSEGLPKQNADQAVVLTADPRVKIMGWRLIIRKEVNPLEIFPGCRLGELKDYHRHRYQQGVPEGTKDLPYGTALPLESNLVYLNGVSFTKGCYIGQELTARTHHMGVIRKRLLPIQLLPLMPFESLTEGTEIVTESGKSAGKFRAGENEFGIALLRLATTKGPLRLKLADDSQVTVTASIPKWWPQPANK